MGGFVERYGASGQKETCLCIRPYYILTVHPESKFRSKWVDRELDMICSEVQGLLRATKDRRQKQRRDTGTDLPV